MKVQASFNPRPHMKGDISDGAPIVYTESFNPRPHMKGDTERLYTKETGYVSIHALT